MPDFSDTLSGSKTRARLAKLREARQRKTTLQERHDILLDVAKHLAVQAFATLHEQRKRDNALRREIVEMLQLVNEFRRADSVDVTL